jgi:hypothetical protein
MSPERTNRVAVWPVFAMAGTGLALLAFVLAGRTDPIPFGFFPQPPLYGRWAPTFDLVDPLTWSAIGAGLVLAAVGWWFTTSERIPTALGLAMVVGAGVATAAGVAVVRGDWTDLITGISTGPVPSTYAVDLPLVCEYGTRGFAEQHPDLVERFTSYSSKTHPPGYLLLLFGLFKVFGADHALRITVVLAVLAMLAAVASYAIGRVLGGERAGRVAAVLCAAAPGPLLLAFTVADAVYATLLASGAALMMVAIHRRSAAWAAAAGAALGVTTLFTYASAFVVLAAVVAVVVQTRSVRDSARLLGAAAGAGLLCLVLGRLVLGIDVWASFQASPGSGGDYDPYWILGSQAAWLLFAGLPVAALGLAGLFRRSPRGAYAVLPLALVAFMFVWAALPADLTDLRPGEVERTWAFLYPLLAGTAGPIVDRWSAAAGRWRGAIVAGLVVVSVAQAILLQSLWIFDVNPVRAVFELACA